jgi:3-hydroxyisobutyrate dehydrogenase
MKIGILGTGLMGQPMALKLLESNYDIIAYNRTAAKLDPIKAVGGAIAASPVEVLQDADCLITMLTNAAAIRETLLSDAAKANWTGKTLIQMATIAPSESQTLQHDIEAAGGAYLEAPVLGSIPQVKTGELLVMVGATRSLFEQWLPVLQVFGKEPVLLGEVGSGSAVKLAMNQLIGSLTTAFAGSLAMVHQQGIDIEAFMEIVRQSALYAPTFDKKLSRMMAGNYENPNFPSKHLLKDMNLFSREAETMGIDAQLSQAVSQVVEQAIAQGLADSDYSALFEAVKGG